MGYCTNTLTTESEASDGFSCDVTVETGIKGRVRMNVTCINEANVDDKRSQGADLTPAECRSLAHMLLSAAELVETGQQVAGS